MLNPSIWKKMSRGPQIITLKDAALISAFTGLQSGDKVVDAGTGSGFLSVYLGSIVAPGGKITSYERRPEFAALARKNVEKAGLQEIIEIREKDVFDGIGEREVDLVALDLAEPEKALGHAANALKMNGFVAAYLPHVEQVKALVREAETLKFGRIRVIEAGVREWLVREYGSRPENTAVVFTGFLVFLQKVGEKEFEEERKASEATKKGRRSARVRKRLLG